MPPASTTESTAAVVPAVTPKPDTRVPRFGAEAELGRGAHGVTEQGTNSADSVPKPSP